MNPGASSGFYNGSGSRGSALTCASTVFICYRPVTSTEGLIFALSGINFYPKRKVNPELPYLTVPEKEVRGYIQYLSTDY